MGGLPLVGASFYLKKWGTKELRLPVMGLKDSRTPMPQQSWSIIQRPKTVWRLSKMAGGARAWTI
jgi:hypothetical protein